MGECHVLRLPAAELWEGLVYTNFEMLWQQPGKDAAAQYHQEETDTWLAGPGYACLMENWMCAQMKECMVFVEVKNRHQPGGPGRPAAAVTRNKVLPCSGGFVVSQGSIQEAFLRLNP